MQIQNSTLSNQRVRLLRLPDNSPTYRAWTGSCPRYGWFKYILPNQTKGEGSNGLAMKSYDKPENPPIYPLNIMQKQVLIYWQKRCKQRLNFKTKLFI